MSRPRFRLHDRLRLFWPAVAGAIEALVHSNVFISVAAASVAVTTMLLAGFRFDPRPPFLVFAVTLFVYSFNRVTDLEEDERNTPRRAAFTRRYGRLALAVGGCLYALAGALAVAWNLPHVEFMLLPLVVGSLYSVGRLKERLLVKNLLVGLSWGVIPLGVGVYFGAVYSPAVVAFAGHVAVMLTVAAVVFDIKDIEGDSEAGISTVPIAVGVAWTRRLAQSVNVVVAGVVLTVVAAGVVPVAFVALLAFHAYVFCYVRTATPQRGPLFYGFVIDGEYVFVALVVAAIETAWPAASAIVVG